MYTSIYVKSNYLLDYTFKTETRKQEAENIIFFLKAHKS